MQRKALFDGRLQIVVPFDLDDGGNAVFSGHNFFVDAGPPATIVKLEMDLQTAISVARHLLISRFIAHRDEGITSGSRGLRRPGGRALAIRHGATNQEKQAILFHECILWIVLYGPNTAWTDKLFFR